MQQEKIPGRTPTESRIRLHWAAAFSLLLVFAVTVHLLHVRLLAYLADLGGGEAWIRNGYYAGAGVIGLTVLFICYSIFRQIQLRATQLALHREELELEDAKARLSELTSLFQAATHLNLEFSLEAILGLIVRRVVGALKAQQASIMLYDEESDALVTRAYYGVEGEFALNGKRKLGEGIAGWVAEHGEAMLLNDAPPHPGFAAHYKEHRSISSALSVPLLVGERCVAGVLNVNRISHPTPFTERQRDILKIFAEHVGAVIHRAEASEQLGQEAAELRRSNRSLHELNRMKDTFLSTASHELKTPLTAVIAYTELLAENEGALAPEQRADFLRRLKGEAERLMQLIEDILDLTRIETGKTELHRKRLSVNDLAHSAVETARPLAEKAGVAVVEEYDAGAGAAWIDEVKMRQAVVNLIVNAVKFSPREGVVRVATTHRDDGLLIEVTDDGPGVAPDEVAKIFALFGQAPREETRGKGGLGIGLHLVKRVVELHEGTVGVRSRPGEGSTFWILVPHPEAPERAA